MELVLPMKYYELQQEEMMHLDWGNISAWDKVLLAGVFFASSIAIETAIIFGALWTVTKIVGLKIKVLAKKCEASLIVGATAVVGIGVAIAKEIMRISML